MTDSKLAKQAALPRRKLYRVIGMDLSSRSDVVAVAVKTRKPKAKAKRK